MRNLNINKIFSLRGLVDDEHVGPGRVPPLFYGRIEEFLDEMSWLQSQKARTHPPHTGAQFEPGLYVRLLELPEHVNVWQGGLHGEDLARVVLHLHRRAQQLLVLHRED